MSIQQADLNFGFTDFILLIWRDLFSLFPVYAGVILDIGLLLVLAATVPRVCGGDPCASTQLISRSNCSPCMRGWFLRCHFGEVCTILFPVYAGVILKMPQPRAGNTPIPRVCGGDPTCCIQTFARSHCSPCMQGWSQSRWSVWYQSTLFPVYAGVIPGEQAWYYKNIAIPRVYGGDP